ncbi:hypothetical protein BGW80DRAFT_1295329 [Lactifluus volemus]|nr:hypothetical protein BGW80DRAFT_1295329 [Lactifluus volemus]
MSHLTKKMHCERALSTSLWELILFPVLWNHEYASSFTFTPHGLRITPSLVGIPITPCITPFLLSAPSFGPAFPTTRMLTQTLSNMVTGNQDLLDHFWALHMRIPEEQSVLIRLLRLPDLRSAISVLVLIMNCIYDSRERGHALITTAIGVRVCVSILDRLEDLLDHSELGDEGKVFELGTLQSNILVCVFVFILQHPGFYLCNRQDEHVSPTQRTLLKLLDSFLQPVSSFRGVDDDNFRNLTGFLVSEFFSQAENVQHTVRQATGMSSSDQDHTTDVLGASDGALDERLPGVCVALILLSTSLSSILLSERETRANESGVGADPNLVRVTLPCRDAIAGSGNSAGTGFIECLIETLRLLDIFLPPIKFGQARPSFPGDGAAVPDRPMMTGFPYLKQTSKPIQDRVRCCGGIPIVLNLCVIDERNPCKSSFFLFLVRELRDRVAPHNPGERNRRARISASFRSHKPIRNALTFTPRGGEGN